MAQQCGQGGNSMQISIEEPARLFRPALLRRTIVGASEIMISGTANLKSSCSHGDHLACHNLPESNLLLDFNNKPIPQ
jgi:hypothetical protein